jgi:hypothetical protein
MDYRDIREKISRYWLGETTLKEERELKTFFDQPAESLPGDLQEVAGLFQCYGRETQIPIPEWHIPDAAATPRHRVVVRHRIGAQYWEYAALLVLLLGSLWMFRPDKPHRGPDGAFADTFQDPQQALQATQKALQIVAANLNKGKVQMQRLGVLHQVEQKIHGTAKQ